MLSAEQTFRKMGGGLERKRSWKKLLGLAQGSVGCRWLTCQREAELACHSRHCRRDICQQQAESTWGGRGNQRGPAGAAGEQKGSRLVEHELTEIWQEAEME